ncbi:hypothetical protein ACWES4_26480, partial [Streptomyces sp. NPDC004011]
LSRTRVRPTRVGFFGTGLIARYIHTYLAPPPVYIGYRVSPIGAYGIGARTASVHRSSGAPTSSGN